MMDFYEFICRLEAFTFNIELVRKAREEHFDSWVVLDFNQLISDLEEDIKNAQQIIDLYWQGMVHNLELLKGDRHLDGWIDLRESKENDTNVKGSLELAKEWPLGFSNNQTCISNPQVSALCATRKNDTLIAFVREGGKESAPEIPCVGFEVKVIEKEERQMFLITTLREGGQESAPEIPCSGVEVKVIEKEEGQVSASFLSHKFLEKDVIANLPSIKPKIVSLFFDLGVFKQLSFTMRKKFGLNTAPLYWPNLCRYNFFLRLWAFKGGG